MSLPQLREALVIYDRYVSSERPVAAGEKTVVAAARCLVEVAETSQEPDYEAIRQSADLWCNHEGHTAWFDRPGSFGNAMGQGPGEFCDHCVALRGFDRRKVVDAAVGSRRLVDPQQLEVE